MYGAYNKTILKVTVSVVTNVSATDEDLGDDGVIEYLLHDVPGSENFAINNETGVIYTARNIDREVYPHIRLELLLSLSINLVNQYDERGIIGS